MMQASLPDDDVDTTPHSRGMIRPSCASMSALENQRAQGMPGAGRTRELVC